jgi:large subunit ribosomal protein L18
MQISTKERQRRRRKYAVRNRLTTRGAATVRLSVHRSAKHIYAQVIDAGGRTLCGTGSTGKALAGQMTGKTKTERAVLIGKEIARMAKEKGIEAVVFDRGSCRYHGRVKALADAARAEGLKF